MHFFCHLGGLFGLGQRGEKPLLGPRHPPKVLSVTKKMHTRTMSDSCMHFFGHLRCEGCHFCLGPTFWAVENVPKTTRFQPFFERSAYKNRI